MTVLTEGRHAAEHLVSEANGYRSREAIIVASGADLDPGTVLGKISVGAASSAAKAGGNAANTGVLTLDATNPVRAHAKVGVYTVRCIAAASNSGTFRVEDPDGFVIGDVAVAATFDDDVKFVIADGAQDFIVGEGFDITIAAGSSKYKVLNPAAVDGSQAAAGVLYGRARAAAADAHAVAHVRDAEVNGGEITWPEGISGPAKATAIAQLKAIGIIVR